MTTSTIYRISTDPDRYDSLLESLEHPLDPWWEAHGFENSYAVLRRVHRGEPFGALWRPLLVVHYDTRMKKNRGKPVDFLCAFPGHEAISERALQVIAPLVGSAIEALPLECVDIPERRYYLLKYLDCVDCLDEERSEIEWDQYSSGPPYVDWVFKYVFKPGSTDGHHLFRDQHRHTENLLVSEEFKQLVEAHDLVGLDFHPATEYLPYMCSPSALRERQERERRQQRKKTSRR